MASLRITLGLIPSTDKIEEKNNTLQQEYVRLKQTETSKELSRYKELKAQIESADFQSKRKEIEAQKYQLTDAFSKEKEYKQLSKDPEIKDYYKLKDSEILNRFVQLEESDIILEYEALKEEVNADRFKERKAYLKLSGKRKFQLSDEYRSIVELDRMKKERELMNYFKFTGKKGIKIYEKLYQSSELTRFEELEKIVNQPDFKLKVKSLKKAGEFAGSEEEKQLNDYQNFKRSAEYKTFVKFKNSSLSKDYQRIKVSEKLEAYTELEKLVNSESFNKKRAEIENESWANSDEYRKEQRYNELLKSSDIKFYYKFRSSKILANYNKLKGSEKVSHFENLKTYIQSEEFESVKAFMKLSPKEKFKRSEQFKLLEEFEQLGSSEDLRFYFKFKDHKKYDEIKRWNLSFEDDFSENRISEKWLKKYFWGEALLQDTFSIVKDNHIFTEKNIEINSNTLRIVTKKEKAKGKTWDARYGFYEKNYEYTSGIINTGSGFRQKYGKIEAKIRFNANYPLKHSFWLVGEKRTPHIDIAKADSGISFNTFWQNGDGKTHKSSIKAPSRYRNDFYIYTLEWTPSKLTWKINDIVAGTKTTGVPQEEMYIAFSSHLHGELKDENLPAVMEVDWVRCWTEN